jgi:GntR family transcriptional regulator/MocR family aminotransferase
MRGVVVEPEHVVICCSASQALTVLCHVLHGRGARRVAIEDPGWRWQRFTAEYAGLEAVPVRVDADGLVVPELAAADVDAVVMTPAHHYPTGVVMTAERRGALIAWARERQALIVEDDYDAEYRFDRPPMAALQGLAPDLVAFVGTASKTLAPALRLGWVVPPSHLIDDVENVLLVTGVTPPTLDQIALASFIEDATLERHLRSMRRRYRAKRNVLLDALGHYLPEVRIGGTDAGLHLLAWLPNGSDEHATAMRARRFEVGVHELHRHCEIHAPSPPALLLGFALPTESQLSTATRLLAEAIC